jgi:hypothetical protein
MLPRPIIELPSVMNRIAVVTSKERDDYCLLPGWDGTVVDHTDEAVFIRWRDRPGYLRDVVLPLAQLRKSADGQTVYASQWLVRKEGLT